MSPNKLFIYPPAEFRGKAVVGLKILRKCHEDAGGVAYMNVEGNGITLEFFGAVDLVRNTMKEGVRVYKINLAWREAEKAQADLRAEKYEAMSR